MRAAPGVVDKSEGRQGTHSRTQQPNTQICAHIQDQLLKVPDKVQKGLCLERH